MTTYTWIKLYIEILDDPKVGMMQDWLFRRFIQFLLFAREYNHDGLLGPVSELAWRLRSSEDDMLNALRTMSEIGIVAETPDGWLVVNFSKRQDALTGAERIQNYRKRERNEDVTKRYENRNETVTAAEIDSSSSSTSDSFSGSFSLEEDKSMREGETKSNVFAEYQDNIALITPMIADELKDAETTYSPEWVIAAIHEAVASNARSWKYCEAILKRWQRDGFKSAKASKPDGRRAKGDNTEFFKNLATASQER